MIDKKQLRIGNHVKCGGIDKIVQIEELREYQVELKGYGWTIHGYDDLAPIPLTAELLQEIGFVKKTRYDNGKDYYIDAESARYMEKNETLIPQIELQNYSDRNHPELWEIKIISICYELSLVHNTTIRYLNELEQFIYLTIGKELVE